ncbi:hypothetical protein BV898_04013 [Hypsibius exemplaris]|uniref:Putative auto-transporter adhesin head GIN domain-containing protein n=1 Tax=Hypsibius exemplaris TaxID=2072580 RepID=A0A1W0X3V0_HYPEX|nr:hypothetical protein BV898_04013 [Hypsibius exemplaris]
MVSSLLAIILALATSYSEAVITENRSVSGFTAVDSAGPFIVIVDLTGTESLRIDADIDETNADYANASKALITTVENQKLKIYFEWPYSQDDGRFAGLIRITITAITLQGITLSGAGSVMVNTPLTGPAVSVVTSGSGNVTLPVKTSDLSIVLSGTGNVYPSGTTSTLSVVINGAGGVAGSNLQADSVSASVYGAGNAVVNANRMLSAVLMGSGVVKYRGAAVLNQVNMGSGHVSHIA